MSRLEVPMHEQEQQVQLTRMRTIATCLLGLMAVVFVVAHLLESRHSGWAFVTAFAEAAMVGALADWFAVTALFRHPLGLPIPHTAIIPNNKDRIGESVAGFLEHNFMTKEVLTEELSNIDFSGAAAHWLADPVNSRGVARQIVRGVPVIIRMIEDEDVGNFMQNVVGRTLQNVKFGPVLGEIFSVLIADRRHQLLFDHLIGLAANALDANRPFIRQKIHEKSPRWVPRMVDEKLYERLLEETQNILAEMREEGSEWRQKFQERAEEMIERLKTSPEYEAKIASVVNQTLNHPLFRSYAEQVWHDVRARVLADATSEESQAVIQLDRALHGFSQALLQDSVIQEKLNRWVRDFAAEAIAGRRAVIADLFRRVIQKWDAETVSRKFELYVGKDLQYIRINGTLVGGLVGLVLHSVSLLF